MSFTAVNSENIRRLEEELLEAKKDSKRASEDLKKSINRLSSLFETQWGKLMESLVAGGLVQILQKRGIDVKNIDPA